MKKVFLLCTVALLAAVGCNKELPEGNLPSGSVVLTASVESDATKVGAVVDEDTKKVAFTWTKGDAIAVYTDAGFVNFDLVGDGGQTTAQFVGSAAPANGAVAVYPAAVAESVSSNNLTVNLPATYTYAAGQTNALMCATVADNKLAFTHLGGLVAVGVKGVPSGAKFVLTADGQKINGAYTVDYTAETPQLSAAATENTEETTVTVSFTAAVDDAVIYLPLPVGEYASWKAQVLSSDDTVLAEETTTSTKTVSRKTLKVMPDMVLSLTLFVTPEGAGDKSGSSWDNAMGVSELRTLIAQPVDADGNQVDEDAHAKAAQLDGAIINMAAGDYYLAGAAGSKVKVEFSNYDKQVKLHFKGGYPAGLTGTATTGCDADANVTAFTGNSEAGIFLFGNQVDVTFDGLTFKNANFVTAGIDGGAIEASSGSTGDVTVTINNCRFIDNKNSDSKTGAAILLKKSSLIMTDSYFSGNYARNGSALSMTSSEGEVSVTGCTFEKNSTFNTSGAVQNGGKTATFTGCTFKGNSAGSWGGGAFHTSGDGAETTFDSCKFEENTAPYGGAISIETATCTFTDCSFTKNTATAPVETSDDGTVSIKNAGGAIILRKPSSVCTLNSCILTENSAVAASGGAVVITDSSAQLTVNAGTQFKDNTAYYCGGAIVSYGKLTIAGTSTSNVLISGNNTLGTGNGEANGGALWLGSGSATDIDYTLFENSEAGKESGSTVNYSNGGAIYLKSANSLTVDNCEFTGGRARNGGCMALAPTSGTDCKFTNCSFHDNICRSGDNHDGTSGNFNGAVGQIGSGEVVFMNCTFTNNVAYKSSAALHMNGGVCVAEFTDCKFVNNKTIDNNHACIKMEKGGQKLFMNRCLFEGNSAPSRGMINPGANTLVYLNDVTFKDNTTTSSGNTWGVSLHCNAAYVCMNNVTSYNNYNTQAVDGNNVISFNSDGGWLVVNSTIIDKTPAALFRANGTLKATFCNNIMINTFSPEKLFVLKSSAIYDDKGHNVMSCSNSQISTGTTDDYATLADSNIFSQSETNLGGSFTMNWTGSHPYGVYLWTNSLTGFSSASAEDVYAAITAYDLTNSAITIEKDNIGADFYNWLVNIGAVTESGGTRIFNDARGIARSATLYPGAYQAN